MWQVTSFQVAPRRAAAWGAALRRLASRERDDVAVSRHHGVETSRRATSQNGSMAGDVTLGRVSVDYCRRTAEV